MLSRRRRQGREKKRIARKRSRRVARKRMRKGRLASPYGALEPYLTKDGCHMMTKDPGDDLWAQTFDWLAPEPSLERRHQADPGRGCAGAGLR